MRHSVQLLARAVRLVGAPVLHKPCDFISHQHIASPTSFSFADDKGEQVSLFTAASELHATLNDFVASNGFGRAIAANQVGFPVRMIAMRLTAAPSSILQTFPMCKTNDLRLTLINPTVKLPTTLSTKKVVWDDCFSFPEYLVRLYRHPTFVLSFFLLEHPSQVPFEYPVTDWSLSELLQHEIDHLDGITAFDRLKETFLCDEEILQDQTASKKSRDVANLPRVITRNQLENFFPL